LIKHLEMNGKMVERKHRKSKLTPKKTIEKSTQAVQMVPPVTETDSELEEDSDVESE
jgi:hypothetical protein